MDLSTENTAGAFGLLMTEAAQRLVDSHDQTLDKRAAMMRVEPPRFSQIDGSLRFEFRVRANRQPPSIVTLDIYDHDDEDTELTSSIDELSELSFSLEACPTCQCEDFLQPGVTRCSHTLATSWWLQEQLARRSVTEIFEFLGELKVDTVAAGREMVDRLLSFADQAAETQPENVSRIQWRIRLNQSNYYGPLTITAYEQRPRKTGAGWTKGREIQSYDLLDRDFSDSPIDAEIAMLVAHPSYNVEGEHFHVFRALRKLAGHPNVVWDDNDRRPVDVCRGEISLMLQPVNVAADEEPGTTPDTQFRPVLSIPGMELQGGSNTFLLGKAGPIEPVVLAIDTKRNRIALCELRDPRATRVIKFLLQSDLSEVLLDSDTAARMTMGLPRLGSLVRVDLPDQLAGPIVAAETELVFEMRPRPGAGMVVTLSAHEPRFPKTQVPAEEPKIVPCLGDDGPVRLRRNLVDEREKANAIVRRFGLDQLSEDQAWKWTAETDETALNLLTKLYEAGEDAPQIIWPEGETIKVRGEITPSALRVQIEDRKDWFGISGTVSLDGQEIKLADLLAAVQERRSLVRVGDREFAKISDAFRRRLEQLGDTLVNERGSFRVADAAVPAIAELIGDDVTLETTARWQETIAKLESLADWTPEKPSALDVDFRDYQLDGFQWLSRLSQWGVGAVLADDMGLGKTVQALGVLLTRSADGPALVIAPTSVGDNWVRETERFAPTLRPLLYRDSDREKLIEAAGPGDLVIASYQLVQRDAERFAKREWNTLVLDEAQYIKNAQTKTSRAIRSLDADWRIALSGTPLENHLGELWSLFRTLSPGLLGSWERFRTRFADPIERHKDGERRASLAHLMRPFILRRTKEKVLSELPPRTEITLQAELSVAERKLYDDARLAALAELSGADDPSKTGEHRMRTLAWLTKLRQLACHPRLVDPRWKKNSAKLELLLNLVQELREGDHRALIFSQFVKHLTVIRESLDAAGVTYQYLDGATPARERQRRVDAFQDGEGELFLISLKAGGTGLNLTAADYVIHLDPWWNPAVEDQATDRAHRIGQERPVTVYRLVASGTIEEQILEMHADKRELVAGVLDGTDRAAKMETEDLIRLIKEGVVAG
ncbi:DEAD/DEAH box helicase [Stieleria varia]|uniref:RNA polymerase-associated protein RapA n=1 Tax=Stieleria varia TaxID=2528005 RepID=A0A5C6A3A7_9BACT|nr:DEAD/DEAH box helicase [Stieleria varia]TWT93738.1 RNA polymerase-associated protein RapA [Stieleria varia]